MISREIANPAEVCTKQTLAMPGLGQRFHPRLLLGISISIPRDMATEKRLRTGRAHDPTVLSGSCQ